MFDIKKLKISHKAIDIIYLFLIFSFFLCIFTVNLFGKMFCTFDIYSDMMTAKHMAESFSLFPNDWTFGNQFYVIATPVISAFFYIITKNAYLSLGLASCTMTILTAICFVWCINPFVKKRSILIGLLSIIGGIIIQSSASSSLNGLQIFYTQASYYSCYVIVLLFTIGIWLRLLEGITVDRKYIAVCGLLNFSLGMQSLRETLVLNIPLCAVMLYVMIIKGIKENWKSPNSYTAFAIGMFLCNVAGLVTIRLLSAIFKIKSIDILKDNDASFIHNLKSTLDDFCNYSGLKYNGSHFSLLHMIISLALFCVVVYSIVNIIKNKSAEPIACVIILCLISLLGVFFTGLFIIKTRPIYFFTWHILSVFSLIYVSEKIYQKINYHLMLMSAIAVVGAMSLFLNFYSDLKTIVTYKGEYNELIETLNDKKYVYSDWRVIEMGTVSAYSNCDIICGTFEFSPEKENMIYHVKYLFSSDWYKKENCNNSYIVLTDSSLEYVKSIENEDYASKLFTSLNFVCKKSVRGQNYYIYEPTEFFFDQLIK